MSTGAMWGWIGAITGCVIGLAGGVIGTYFSIRNTHGPRERRFMIRPATVCWIGILVFFALLIALPDPYRWLVWIPYSILLPLGVTLGNRKQHAIMIEEAQDKELQAQR